MLTINTGDVAFMVIATVLVAIMTPGLAFFYGGLVRKKDSLTMMMYSFLAIGVVTILWVLGGFSMVFGDTLFGVIGNPLQFFYFNGMDFAINANYGAHIPFLMFFMYQLMFAIITAPLMSGAFASRVSLGKWIIILILWNILIYFPVAHWVWGGGFLQTMGFVDFAGGTVIHTSAGFAALASIFALGKRADIPNNKPGNIPLALVGGGLLIFGWFGFNSGGALAVGREAAIAFTNTGIACAFAMMTWVVIRYVQTKKFSAIEMITGAVAGLATITPAAGYVAPQFAVVIGILSAPLCICCLGFAKKMKWDDALGVWGVHGMGGYCGTLAIGLFAAMTINKVSASFDQFLVQLLGASLVAAYSFVVTYLIFKVVMGKASQKVSDEIQIAGLDQMNCGEEVE